MELLYLLALGLFVSQTSAEYCIQGQDEGCRFECHCKEVAECRSGLCPSGCANGQPSNYKWSGPACQTGNIGFNKTANMTVIKEEHNIKYPAGGALDGVIVTTRTFNKHCAHPSNNDSMTPHWWADLGSLYSIESITVYGRRDCCQKRLQQFEFRVYNTSDREVLCGNHNQIVYTSAKITCHTPVVGRYVHFQRYGGEDIQVTAFCEVVIMGYKIYDCSKCPSGISCNSMTGCQECIGSYQPECQPECRDGSHGVNCNERCGNCSNSSPCDKITGDCPDGCQLWWADDKCKTYIDKPVFYNETMEVVSTTDTSITIKWHKLYLVQSSVAQFYGYVVIYKENDKQNFTEFTSVRHESKNDVFIVEIQGLKPNTEYDVTVKPYRNMNTVKDYGKVFNDIHIKTNCSAPEKPRIWNVTVSDTESNDLYKITIYFQDLQDINPNCQQITGVLLNYKLSDRPEVNQIPIELSKDMITILVNDTGNYEVWISVTNEEGYSSKSKVNEVLLSASEGSSSLSTSLAAVFSVILLVIIVFVGLLIWKRKNINILYQNCVKTSFVNDGMSNNLAEEIGSSSREHTGFENSLHTDKAVSTTPTDTRSLDDVTVSISQNLPEDEEDENIYINSAVSVLNFEGYVRSRKKEIKGLYKEYEMLPQADLERCETALTSDNKEKNRFRNIYAYDSTRVLLKKDNDTSSDYINASYITGYSRKIEYIATQGPRSNTLVDFWTMVWQEDSNRIVMVANVMEMGKQRIDPYWPEEVDKEITLGDFNIKIDGIETSADYTTRIMTVRKQNESRVVHHFHFTTWKDKDKPQHGIHTLLAFMTKVHSFDPFSRGPLIVHCSAGVGRTGTFIALDILQQMAKTKKTIDIYTCVQNLRRERMHMVQTKEQYVFLHDALVEFIKYDNTSHDCSTFTQMFESVLSQQPNPEVLSVLEKEFKMLCDSKQKLKTTIGIQEENRNKNRVMTIIPGDFEVIFITGLSGTYINAIAVDSFAAHDSCIVTQMPLPHTISDFWSLVLQENCQAIVMLNELETSQPYWSEGKETYGPIEVELSDVDKTLDFLIIRDFRMKRKSLMTSQVITVRQFQLTSWPKGQKLPSDRGHILQLIDKLQQWQQRTNTPTDKWKILVHCFDGGSRSGMFCGCSFLLDRMKVEQDVNAYLAVKYVGRKRPQFFTELYEYQFLYQMAVEYLMNYSEYGNFQ